MREKKRRKRRKAKIIFKENLKRYERQMIIVDRIWIVLFRFFLHIIILFLIHSVDIARYDDD